MAEAQKWIQGLTNIRNEAKANTIPEEPEKSHESSQAERVSHNGKVEVEKAADWSKKEEKPKSCCIVM